MAPVAPSPNWPHPPHPLRHNLSNCRVEPATSRAAPVEPATAEPVAEESKPADDPATQEPVDDKNYQLLGEFAGDIELPGNPPQQVGLQVRPLGEIASKRDSTRADYLDRRALPDSRNR